MSRWVDQLSEEDVAFLRRFVLNSGSLKAVAQEYGISYPTVRLRLDRLIQKIELWESLQHVSEFERRLRALVIEGKLDTETMTQLLRLHQQDREQQVRPTIGKEEP